MLQLKNISKTYKNSSGELVRTIFSSCNFKILEQETIAIIGPSGSGKTTLLNLIGGMDKPDSGEIHFEEKNITNLTNREMLAYRSKKVGFVFQNHYLLPQCTLLENVLLPTLAVKTNDKNDIEYAEYLLNKLAVWNNRYQKPGELSGGECQRTALARALINKPKLLLADEPTGALDTENSQKLIDLILELNQSEKITVLLVTHSLEAAGRMQKRYQIKQKELEQIS